MPFTTSSIINHITRRGAICLYGHWRPNSSKCNNDKMIYISKIKKETAAVGNHQSFSLWKQNNSALMKHLCTLWQLKTVIEVKGCKCCVYDILLLMICIFLFDFTHLFFEFYTSCTLTVRSSSSCHCNQVPKTPVLGIWFFYFNSSIQDVSFRKYLLNCRHPTHVSRRHSVRGNVSVWRRMNMATCWETFYLSPHMLGYLSLPAVCLFCLSCSRNLHAPWSQNIFHSLKAWYLRQNLRKIWKHQILVKIYHCLICK